MEALLGRMEDLKGGKAKPLKASRKDAKGYDEGYDEVQWSMVQPILPRKILEESERSLPENRNNEVKRMVQQFHEWTLLEEDRMFDQFVEEWEPSLPKNLKDEVERTVQQFQEDSQSSLLEKENIVDEEESWLQDPHPFRNEMDKNYARLLICLQPDYRMIGEEEAPVLGALEKEIYGHPLAGNFVTNKESLLSFLSIFFRPFIVYQVERTFDMTVDSLLGEEYTRRGTYSSIASTLLSDLCQKANLMSARSQIAVSAGGTSSGSTRDRVQKDDGGEDRGAVEEASIGGDGGGAEDVLLRLDVLLRRVDELLKLEAMFTKIPIQDIPEKKRGMTSEEKKRQVTITERTTAFVTQPLILELLKSTPGIFDMRVENNEYVLLFHGTRTEHFPEFQRVGIAPSYVRNELSTKPAFYVTNDIDYAFEHPIHKHALGNAERNNHILIFGFRVNMRELCVSPGGGEAPFHIKKFLIGEDENWLKFCVNNLNQVRTRDCYDIVMGPICIPKFDQQGKINHVKLLTWGADSGNRWQIAFISARAQDWLQKHLVYILRELREC